MLSFEYLLCFMKYIQAKNFVFSAKKAPQYGEFFIYLIKSVVGGNSIYEKNIIKLFRKIFLLLA